LISITAKSQILPDSIIITKNSYVNNFTDNDSLIKSEDYNYCHLSGKYICKDKTISESKAKSLIDEINNPSNKLDLLTKFEIDTAWIKQNPEELLKPYSNKYYNLSWNQQQKEYIFKKLTDLNDYKHGLIRYLSNGGSYTMHNFYRQDFFIQFYNNGLISNQIKSRKYVWGNQMPWVNLQNDTIYNLNIEILLNPYTDNKKIPKPLKGEKLLKYLTNEIIDNNMQPLYKLSAYSYLKEIEELKTDFKIVSHEEVYGRGRYIWNEPKTMKITLKNDSMLPNVYLQFLASKIGKTLYSRDSIKKDYKVIINRVQSISFIIDYLKQNLDVQLDIYYFNNCGINQYNIDGVNKNPIEWKKQDDYIESLKWYEKSNIKPSFDINEAIKTSERNYCGCNYKFDNDFIKKAIFFELSNKVTRENSVWFLLPDNKILLYIMEGNKVLNYDYELFGKYTGIQFPCILFTNDGKIIERK
jgi:hypothetical protein